MDERELVKKFCAIRKVTYLSHERYVSGWDDKRRDELRIAVEDGFSGRYELCLEYDRVWREVMADEF